MNKKIWFPVIMGLVTAVIGFLITYANLTIYIESSSGTGLPGGYDGREIFMLICAALGGPLAALFAILQFPFIGLHLSLPATGVAVIMLDRFVSSVAVAFSYKYLHTRIKKLPWFLLIWAAVVWMYYVISFNIELVSGCILSHRKIIEIYQQVGIRAIVYPFTYLEPPITYFFTVLIWAILPAHLRKPLWSRTEVAAPEPSMEKAYDYPNDAAEDR